MSATLEQYIHQFQHLHISRSSKKFFEGKAPHKPTLLLSLILLFQNDSIDLRDIRPRLYLRETWAELWGALGYESVGPIYLPLYHMKSEPFWHTRFHSSITAHQPRSLPKLEAMAEKLRLDEALIGLLSDDTARSSLINALLNAGYYSEEQVGRLRETIEALDRSFAYERQLQTQIHETFDTVPEPQMEPLSVRRDPAFRRMVLELYDESCAVCGLKIVSSTGVSVVDAAHILPFNRFGNDDLRNGIALCKNHHWCFDTGLITVSANYRVRVSTTVVEEVPATVLSALRRHRIRLPAAEEQWPAPVVLQWHAKHIFQDR